MKHVNYELSEGDIKAITAALSIFPAYEFTDELDANVVSHLCISAGEKLIEHKQLTQQDIHLIALAVDSAYKALRDELSLSDEDAKSEIRKHQFTFNKLHSFFSPLLHM